MLAEPFVGMDTGGLLQPAVQDVASRGHVGLIKVGGTWVRAERVPEAERGNWILERPTFLREELARTPRASHSDDAKAECAQHEI